MYMPYRTSCFALTATALIAKQMTRDRKEGPGGKKVKTDSQGHAHDLSWCLKGSLSFPKGFTKAEVTMQRKG